MPYIAAASTPLVIIDNSGPLEQAAQAMVRVLIGDEVPDIRYTRGEMMVR